MPKPTVWTPPEDSDEPLFVRMLDDRGTPTMAICERDGGTFRDGQIASIRTDGTLRRCLDVNPDLAARAGIALDYAGRIKLSE